MDIKKRNDEITQEIFHYTIISVFSDYLIVEFYDKNNEDFFQEEIKEDEINLNAFKVGDSGLMIHKYDHKKKKSLYISKSIHSSQEIKEEEWKKIRKETEKKYPDYE